MILKIKLGLLILSFSINLLHGFIPHSHEDQLSTSTSLSQHSEHHNFLSFVERIISFNLGADHLEHYSRPLNQIKIGFVHDCLLIACCSDCSRLSAQASLIITSDDPAFPSLDYFIKIIARGPPSLIF